MEHYQNASFNLSQWTMMFSSYVKVLSIAHRVYERVGHVLGFIVQGKSDLPIKCLKSSDCADFTYHQI